MAKFKLTPLDEETAARLEAKHGHVLRFVVPLRADLRVDVVARPFDPASFDRHFDDAITNPDDAVTNTLIRHILWPYGAQLDALVDAFGFLPGAIVGALVQQAGGGSSTSSGARVDPLDESTPDAILAAAALTREQAASLVDSSGGLVALSLITLQKGRGAIVVRAPSYSSLQRLERAQKKRAGLAQACRQAVLDGTAWSTEKIDEMLARMPALAANVVAPEILRLGGAGAEAQFLGGADADRGTSL